MTCNLRVEVASDSGKPLPGARVLVSKDVLVPQSPYPASNQVRVDALTDNQGIASTALDSVHAPEGAAISLDGYYVTTVSAAWEAPRGSDGKTRSAVIKAVLKPIKNPIAMHAGSMIGEPRRYIRIPVIDREYGYDLLLCKPLPPLGDGLTADFFFVLAGNYVKKGQYHLELKVHFPNEGEGLFEFLTPQRWSMHEPTYTGSLLQSDHQAPEAGYVSSLIRTTTQEPGGSRQRETSPKRNFYFRCRTKFGPDGRIASVNYGKIYGDFDFCGGNPEKGYLASFGWSCSYLNPNPNDRNVEFDTNRNLTSGIFVQWP